jgi:sugar-phosphatase
MECPAILFDLDGVLIDSTACVERHWRAWASKHHLEVEPILRIAHGVRNIETMRLVAPHLDAEEEAAQFAADEVADTVGVVAVEAAPGLIAALSDAPWAIVTSCSAALAQARLGTAQLAGPPVLITGSDVARGKPDPQPYLLAASRLGVVPGNCVVVEDAPAGIRSAKRAGMRVIGVAFTYDPADLVASGADTVIDGLADLVVRRLDNSIVLETLST